MKLKSGRLLHITLLAGLILLGVSGAVLTVFFLIERGSSSGTRVQDGFFRLLREYDTSLSVFYGTEREYDHLHSTLDRLEKNAISVESWLSVLKRRRALALNHRPSIANYNNTIDKALAAFPASQPIAAIAASALVRDSAITDKDELKIRQLLPHFREPSYNSLRLSLHILMGDFKNPQRAASVLADIASDGTEAVTVDLALLKTIRGNHRGAMADIQTLINTDPLTESHDILPEEQLADNTNRISDNTLRFAAELYYDFGDLERSAEIFSMINDTSAISRQADALHLAGFRESAVNLWNILVQTESAQAGGNDSQIVTSLYNLAVIALENGNSKEAEPFLERLYNSNYAQGSGDSSAGIRALNSRQFGLIRYSRLFELPRGAAILRGNASFPPAGYPYIDLEICKRLSREWNLNRQTAETWQLLDRHPKNEELYRWAAWHLYFQRRLDEIPILISRFNTLKYDSPWVNFYRALLLMNDGDLERAEKVLLSIPAFDAAWYVNANLGRIYEDIHSLQRAVNQYEEAILKHELSIDKNKKAAARVYQRMARCFTAMSRPSDALKALLQAIELDPDNMGIKLELERLMY